MSRLLEKGIRNIRSPQRGNESRICQNGTIHTTVEDHAQSRMSFCMDDMVDIDAMFLHLFEHETSKKIIATGPNESDSQAKPRGTTGKNGGGRTNGQRGRIDQFFNLTKLRRYISSQDQVRVDLACYENVVGFHIM